MEWEMIFPYSILAIFFHSILKIFHSILKFSYRYIFHSIAYQGKFRPEAMHTYTLYCTFATLSVLLQVVTHEGKQCGSLVHLIPYLKHYRNALGYYKNSLSIQISSIGVANFLIGGQNANHMQ